MAAASEMPQEGTYCARSKAAEMLLKGKIAPYTVMQCKASSQ